jgi:hypothetical protein
MINLFRIMAGVPHVQFTNATRAAMASQVCCVHQETVQHLKTVTCTEECSDTVTILFLNAT